MVDVPLVVHYWTDLQSVRWLRRYRNIARTRNVSECLYSLYAWLSLRRSSVGDASSVGDGLADWLVTVGVVEVGVVDTRYGVSQPGADAER